MNEKIKADLYRVVGGSPTFSNVWKGFRSKGFQYLYFLRNAQSKNAWVRLVCRLMARRLMYKYGFQIPAQCSIGPGLFIGHFGTIVISVNASLGANCNIAHNVTIGAARGAREGAPQIGDRVWIGTGAVVVGNIKIGSDVMIAPNSFVNVDVPSHSLVLGNPAKIISKENATAEYINNRWE